MQNGHLAPSFPTGPITSVANGDAQLLLVCEEDEGETQATLRPLKRRPHLLHPSHGRWDASTTTISVGEENGASHARAEQEALFNCNKADENVIIQATDGSAIADSVTESLNLGQGRELTGTDAEADEWTRDAIESSGAGEAVHMNGLAPGASYDDPNLDQWQTLSSEPIALVATASKRKSAELLHTLITSAPMTNGAGEEIELDQLCHRPQVSLS
ncbi:unnamed protein product [Protopolystoma xenopodis]|uniref:Uncharacterized protein n=1 Tax=Protopolystoma xenopodis TaxID=117903 RepID=A0A448XHH1_9PLAT|nr:unnamed protein product [Protopolystoma xenopodis]